MIAPGGGPIDLKARQTQMRESTQDAQTMLSKVDLFAGTSARRLKKIATLAKLTIHDAGREVAAEGRGALAFHLILSGQATVTKGRKELRKLGPGDYFGEISMLDGLPRSATVTAASPLQTLAISHSSFDQLLKDDPQFTRALLKLLCGRLRSAES